MKSMFKGVGAFLLVAAVFAACSESNVNSPTSPEFGQFALVERDVNFTVCKVYKNIEAAGDYTFAYTGAKAGDGEFVLPAADASADGANNFTVCDNNPASEETIVVASGSTFTVSELAVGLGQATLQFVSLNPFADCAPEETEPELIATGTMTIVVDDTNCLGTDYRIIFKNLSLDEPGGGEGCTPGYWRQPHHYGNWTAPYAPSTEFHSVFGGTDFGDDTLGEAIAYRGGGLNALARHAVAALLNAAHPDIDYGFAAPADVVAAYDAAYTGNRATLNAQKDEFDELNNAGCELGRAELGG